MYGAKPPGRNIYVRNSGVQILHHHDQLNYHQPTARCVCWVQAKRLDDAMPSYDQNTQRHPKLSLVYKLAATPRLRSSLKNSVFNRSVFVGRSLKLDSGPHQRPIPIQLRSPLKASSHLCLHRRLLDKPTSPLMWTTLFVPFRVSSIDIMSFVSIAISVLTTSCFRLF